jgi:hypothetical protein
MLLSKKLSDQLLTIVSSAISLDFVTLIGQHFQIRDDYMNLIDDEVCPFSYIGSRYVIV